MCQRKTENKAAAVNVPTHRRRLNIVANIAPNIPPNIPLNIAPNIRQIFAKEKMRTTQLRSECSHTQ